VKLLGGALLTGFAAPAYAFAEVLGRPVVTRYGLVPPRWPDGLQLSVAVVADIHACDPWMSADRVAAIVEQTNALGADLILLLGDYLTTTRFVTAKVSAAAVSERLSHLSAPLGVYAILGNHDYSVDDAVQRDPKREPRMATALRAVGIPTLINESLRLSKDGHAFWLAGLADQLALMPAKAYGRRSFVGLDDLDATLADIPRSAPVLLLAHEPDIFPRVGNRASLTLSGHTHGGQIDLLGWRPVSASSGSKRYPSGHFEEDGSHLIVSKGLGVSGLPFRVGCWPEILLIQLGTP
jgi:uncharacterized protein